MKNVNLELFCKNCEKNIRITKKNLVPSREYGWDCDQFLIFKGRCPDCLDVFEVYNSLIPEEIKIELMYKYAGITDATLSIWYSERDLRKAKEELIKSREYLQRSIDLQKEREQDPNYEISLFPEWNPINLREKKLLNDRTTKKTNN